MTGKIKSSFFAESTAMLTKLPEEKAKCLVFSPKYQLKQKQNTFLCIRISMKISFKVTYFCARIELETNKFFVKI